MESIIEILVWPITTIIVVMLLRSPLSELVVTLKKLKYKDLELEFEKEANKILADVERDLPEPPKPEVKETKDPGVLFSRRRLDPAVEIMESWRHLELKLRGLSGDLSNQKSIGQIIRELSKSGKISKETSKAVLELSSLRNRVAHTHEEVITYNLSSSVKESISRIMAVLESSDA